MVVRRLVGGLLLCTRRALSANALHPPRIRPPLVTRPPYLLPPVGSPLFPFFYSTNAEPVEHEEPSSRAKERSGDGLLLDEEPASHAEERLGDGLSDEEPSCPAKEISPSGLSDEETRKLLKLIQVDELKKKLQESNKHCMTFREFTELCKELGTVFSSDDAEELARDLDEAGVVLIFRNKIFLRPEKVAELLAGVMPLHLAEDNDPRKEELLRLQKEKDEIDNIAHRQVRKMLWTGLLAFSCQSIIFFRLTFWDLSWDVMEPITFFVTSSGLIFGFLFFIVTSRDPSYNDLMHTILSSKQRKLMKKRNFDMERFKALHLQCCSPYFDKKQNAGLSSH